MSVSEALAFDMYGTLVDPIRIWKQLERYLPRDAQRIAELWRQKQLEYTFRLTAMERYEDFEQVTRKALDYALAAAGYDLDTQQKSSLMAQYNDLECFADVEPGLQRLKEAGYSMVVFSNGSPALLCSSIASSHSTSARLNRTPLKGYIPRSISTTPW
jgi:2-haloacid dehalogenase